MILGYGFHLYKIVINEIEILLEKIKYIDGERSSMHKIKYIAWI